MALQAELDTLQMIFKTTTPCKSRMMFIHISQMSGHDSATMHWTNIIKMVASHPGKNPAFSISLKKSWSQNRLAHIIFL
jgi:hypothetical protein